MAPAAADLLPPGRHLELPHRGITFIRELTGPPRGPTVMLLHGWTATADLNFVCCYGPLAEQARVIAIDHRGHGRGLRSDRPFRLEDCADDAIAVADALGLQRFIPVGYSMGGAVAQLVARRAPERIAGLVLCATAGSFRGTRGEQLRFAGLGSLAAVSRIAPSQLRSRLVERYLGRQAGRGWEQWAIDEVRLHDWTNILEAGHAIGRFSSKDWVRSLPGPSAVIVTTQDGVVPVRRQERLVRSLRARRFEVHANHDACVAGADEFVPALLAAVHSVSRPVVGEPAPLASLGGEGE